MLDNKRSGIALLITLSVTVLISLIVMNSFEKTSLEIKMFQNEEERYRINSITDSILKIFVQAIKISGANKVYKTIDKMAVFGDVPIPINSEDPDILIASPKIWSLDHYFNINKNYHLSSDGSKYNKKILTNIIKNHANWKMDNSQFIHSFIGAITDWKDTNTQEVSSNALVGAESYPLSIPPLQVKNSSFELLSELKILPSFQSLSLLKKAGDLGELPVRMKDDSSSLSSTGCVVEALNINMLPRTDKSRRKKELDRYMSLTRSLDSIDGCEYKELQDNQSKIYEILDKHYTKKNNVDYIHPLNTDPHWKSEINAATDKLLSKIVPFFSSRSKFVGISFQIRIGTLIRKITAYLKLNYSSNTSINSIDIWYYKER